MQTNSTCPSSSNNSSSTGHGGAGSGSDPDAYGTGNNSTMMQAEDQKAGMIVNWSTTTTSSHSCPYCTKSFETSQALGGHQNAHRRERDADRREYLASRSRANTYRMATARTIMAAAHDHHHTTHSARGRLPMLPHSASVFGISSSSARGYGYGYGYGGYGSYAAANYDDDGGNGFVHHHSNNSVYAGVPVQGPAACPYCRRRWFINNYHHRQQQQQQAAPPIEYKFIPPYEADFLGSSSSSSSSSSALMNSSSSSSATSVIVLDGEEHQVEVNTKQLRRLDLTLRL